jgi:hypothetical protein
LQLQVAVAVLHVASYSCHLDQNLLCRAQDAQSVPIHEKSIYRSLFPAAFLGHPVACLPGRPARQTNLSVLILIKNNSLPAAYRAAQRLLYKYVLSCKPFSKCFVPLRPT